MYKLIIRWAVFWPSWCHPTGDRPKGENACPPLCPLSEMDITSGFGPEIGGSNPPEGTMYHSLTLSLTFVRSGTWRTIILDVN
jgi:hypothetical protein